MFLQYGETIHSFLPWGIPLWDPSYLVFLGVFYLVLTALGLGLGLVFYRTYIDIQKEKENEKSE